MLGNWQALLQFKTLVDKILTGVHWLATVISYIQKRNCCAIAAADKDTKILLPIWMPCNYGIIMWNEKFIPFHFSNWIPCVYKCHYGGIEGEEG